MTTGDLFGTAPNLLANAMVCGAFFSEDQQHRYQLWRIWSDAPLMVVVLLNPSVADVVRNDPTVRKCIQFAKRWGYGGLIVLNLFAYRSTDPKALPHAADPVGPENDRHIREVLGRPNVGVVVAGWGADRFARSRAEVVKAIIRLAGRPLQCWGTNDDGSPKHPLYLPYTTERRPL